MSEVPRKAIMTFIVTVVSGVGGCWLVVGMPATTRTFFTNMIAEEKLTLSIDENEIFSIL